QALGGLACLGKRHCGGQGKDCECCQNTTKDSHHDRTSIEHSLGQRVRGKAYSHSRLLKEVNSSCGRSSFLRSSGGTRFEPKTSGQPLTGQDQRRRSTEASSANGRERCERTAARKDLRRTRGTGSGPDGSGNHRPDPSSMLRRPSCR